MARVGILRGASAALMLALLGGAPAAAEEPRRHPLVPDHAKLQFAGSIGLVSAGTGYAFAGRRLELDLFGGWVPASIADTDLLALTAKFTWLPWSMPLGGDWRLRPLTAGAALTYWRAGDRFFIQNPDRYPPGYIPLPTALRGSVQVGGTLGRSVKRWSELALYWELVAVDLPLAYWLQNRSELRPTDVFTLALGVRTQF